MKYAILFILTLPMISRAQPTMYGIGPYRIGITIPDSLQRTDFKEEDQPVVKGTLTLPCTHVRLFTAGSVTIEGISVENIVLFFYDNRLFKLSCAYSEALKKKFTAWYGSGIPKPKRSVSFCDRHKDKPALVWGESWQNGDILAFAVYSKGYNSDCRPEENASLIISSQQVSALASDCELTNISPLIMEFDNVLNSSKETPKKR